ncbi:MAG TPA: UDP-N-acetylmuramoyl-L-alanyl-D-glutamate--2,6-diaminopimelate ligase [Steroidobacteraceae bacterium]|jgi:UDP-N-acetylmuramoyl-L-alanyl-D-glutamate--2,6-diaminopimelate ligase|nr:UDP-N-acetylmuramoyl-L-alanyl-D-glutamate--2,6-diaminopimelate ligase [Steroidobacteraceae bacterium]
MTVSLAWLLDGIATLPPNDTKVADLSSDSREVKPGSLFLALKGRQSHGLEFAAEAAARGAGAVLWEPGPGVDAPSFAQPVFAAPIAGLSALVGRIADRFFQWPSSHVRVVGITGTNGKTTCAYLAAQTLTRLGTVCAYIGTLGWGRIGALEAPTHTTPDAVSVHRMLARLRTQGVSTVAMEVSSHALDQGRVDGVRFHTAAFTNLTRDHLDYHRTMHAYGEAKARLFEAAELKHIVVNIGDGFGRELATKLAGRAPLTAVWAGESSGAWLAEQSLHADRIALELHGISMDLGGSFGKLRLSTRLLGRFNAENALVVIASLLSLGVPLQEAAAGLAGCAAPPGRMELIESPAQAGPPARGKPLVVIDYAHTPDALAKALTALREHCRGQLWCVFGCGGDRDPGKRPMMGAVADELADRIVVTDDNPRSENPAAIVRAITGGVTTHRARIIHDRGAAIAEALNAAKESDIVLIAGKGHEDYQIHGATRRSFSDRAEALKVLGAAA